MVFKEIKVNELDHFINSDLYKNSPNIAITKQRAISQLHNPRAKKDAIALIIAINNTHEIVGFIGSLPDKINTLSDINFSWNSCWWIDQKKGKQAAIPLLFKFLKVWSNNVAFRDMTPKTRKIILGLNKFSVIKNLNGFRYFLRFNTSTIFTRKNKLLLLLKPFFLVFDFLANHIIGLKYTKTKNNYHIKHIDLIDDETALFINQLNKKEFIKRGKMELNWILNYPWIIKKSKSKNQFYYFSDEAKIFNNYLVKIYDNTSKLIGIVFLNNHNGLFKIPYIYFEKEDCAIIVEFLFNFLKSKKAISFLTFNKLINDEIQKKRNPFWLKKQNNKELVISKKLASQINWDFTLQDGDGDFAFT